MDGSVRKRGNKWYYAFEGAKMNGKRMRYERVGGNTKAEALRALRKALDEFENSGDVLDMSNISVHDYFWYWFDHYVMKELKYNTQENYRMVIRLHILPYIGKYKLKAIQPAAIQKVIDNNYDKGLSKKTLTIIRSVLNGGFRKAVYPFQLIKNDPTRFLVMPKYDERNKKTKEDLKIITLKEFQKLTDHVKPNHPFFLPMMIAFNTGLRKSEVVALTWDNIDFDEQTLTVDKIIVMQGKEWKYGTPKTQSSYRTIDIGDNLLNLLKSQKKKQMENRMKYGQYYTKNNFICTKENGNLFTPNSIKHYARKVSQETGINFTFHSFRHTHATLLLENGAIDKAIQERLGHSRISTTMDTYSHLTKKTKKETVNIFEKLLNE